MKSFSEMMNSEKGHISGVKRIAVLGMGRSGTSFLTQFLAECGIYVGEVSTKYEHPSARRINESILEGLFGARRGLPYGTLPDCEIQVPQVWHSGIREFIEQMDRQTLDSRGVGYWAFKDPRTTVLHTLWIGYFDVIVAIFRSPEQVVESYLARNWINGWKKRQIALNYWLRFNQSLLEVWKMRHGQPMYVADYNVDIPEQMSRLCCKLNLTIPDRAWAVFDKTQNHFSDVRSLNDPRVAGTYRSLREIRNLM